MSREFELLKVRASTKRVWLASEICSLQPIERRNFPCLACDRFFRAYYGKEFFLKYSKDQQLGILIGSIYRLALNHYSRAKAIRAIPQIWQIASALDVHCMVKNDNLELPQEVIMPEVFGLPNDLSVESYYDLLVQLAENQNKQMQEMEEMSDEELLEKGTDGSAADGEAKSWEEAAPGYSESTPPGMSEEDIEILRDALAEKIKSRGDVPGGFQRLIKERLPPKVDWKKELHALIRKSTETVRGVGDFTYRRLPRKSPPLGLQIAANISHSVRVAVVIDTSGSMSSKELSQAVGEVSGVLKSLPPGTSVDVLACDAMTHVAKKVFRADDIEIMGGGGTDMRIGIQDAIDIKPKPDCVIVISDGYTPWPEQKPDAEVVVCLTQKPTEHLPIWMKFVVVELDN